MRIRVIACLTIDKGRLVKTIKFKNARYIGDPMNAVRIFERKQVDELVLLDITATKEGRKPDFELIEKIAEETFFPFAYGGGIHTIHDAQMLIRNLGVEKVVVRNEAFTNLDFISELADEFGSQSIVVSLDVRKSLFGNSLFIIDSNLRQRIDRGFSFVKKVQDAGAGEIFLQVIDRDGMMNGYDIELVKSVSTKVDIPVVACGGCGKFDDFKVVVKEGKADAVAAGSYFIYQKKNKGVLINYPSREKRKELTK